MLKSPSIANKNKKHLEKPVIRFVIPNNMRDFQEKREKNNFVHVSWGIVMANAMKPSLLLSLQQCAPRPKYSHRNRDGANIMCFQFSEPYLLCKHSYTHWQKFSFMKTFFFHFSNNFYSWTCRLFNQIVKQVEIH